MASAFQVAKFIRSRLPGTNAFKLQKLLYYAQAWSLVWRDRTMFTEAVQARTHGPVVPEVWADISHNAGHGIANASELNADDAGVVDHMLTMYGHLTGDELIVLTHAEQPWIATRRGLPSTAKSNAAIAPPLMRVYYAALWQDACESNAALNDPPAFTGSVDELAAQLA